MLLINATLLSKHRHQEVARRLSSLSWALEFEYDLAPTHRDFHLQDYKLMQREWKINPIVALRRRDSQELLRFLVACLGSQLLGEGCDSNLCPCPRLPL